jgi:hypothetical protein
MLHPMAGVAYVSSAFITCAIIVLVLHVKLQKENNVSPKYVV